MAAPTKRQRKEQEKEDEMSLVDTYSVIDFEPDDRLLELHIPTFPQFYDTLVEPPKKL